MKVNDLIPLEQPKGWKYNLIGISISVIICIVVITQIGAIGELDRSNIDLTKIDDDGLPLYPIVYILGIGLIITVILIIYQNVDEFISNRRESK